MPDLNKLTEAIIGVGIEVHQRLGPGLLDGLPRIVNDFSDTP
jgi:hypothetical protein